MEKMGSVISLGWNTYDWAVLMGDSQPLQNALARTTVVLVMSMADEYFLLVATGSLPSVVYRMTVPSGAPSGRLNSSWKAAGEEVAKPFLPNTTAPRMLSVVSPQLAAPGVGVT